MVEVRTVAIIGAGTLGRRLATLFSGAGYETILEDVLPSNLRRAREEFDRTGDGDRPVRFATSVEDAVRTADLIVDCVPDELESKLEIFSLLDRMAPPRSVLVTPTRTLSIADLASCTYREDRCVALELPAGMAAMDDLKAGDCIALIQTSRTAPEVRDAVEGFWRHLGFDVAVKMDAAEENLAADVQCRSKRPADSSR